MNLSIEMFDMPRARRRDPETSKRAGINAATFASSHAGRILQALRQHGPSAPPKIEKHTGLSIVQIDRRLIEMQRAGLIRVTQAAGSDLVIGGYRCWEAA